MAPAESAPPSPSESNRQPGGAPTRSGRELPPRVEPIPLRDRVGVALVLLSAAITACGSYMWLGRGTVAWIGIALLLAGVTGIVLTTWSLEPHDAARRARDRAQNRRQQRRHARRQTSPSAMSEAEFEALEDTLEPLYKHGNDLDNTLDPYRGL